MFNPHRQHHEINKLARPAFVAISPDSTLPSRSNSQLFRAMASLHSLARPNGKPKRANQKSRYAVRREVGSLTPTFPASAKSNCPPRIRNSWAPICNTAARMQMVQTHPEKYGKWKDALLEHKMAVVTLDKWSAGQRKVSAAWLCRHIGASERKIPSFHLSA